MQETNVHSVLLGSPIYFFILVQGNIRVAGKVSYKLSCFQFFSVRVPHGPQPLAVQLYHTKPCYLYEYACQANETVESDARTKNRLKRNLRVDRYHQNTGENGHTLNFN